MAKELRSGYTTGACAAAGVKAILLAEAGAQPEQVALTALDGTELLIPVRQVQTGAEDAFAEVVKFSGDDPDITNGVSVFVRVRHRKAGEGIRFLAGEGIGRVTKPGLSVPVGEPAINPGPRQLIRNVVMELLGENAGLEVTISIPAGTELAKRTLNPVLGVEGGISVIGTTGVLRPMSEEAFRKSLIPQIDVAVAAGMPALVFVPGKIGEKAARHCGLPEAAIVQTSNFIGYLLEAAAERGAGNVLLFGHIGKLVKLAAGVFYTHNRIGDGRMETMAAYAAAEGLPREGVCRILAAAATEDAMRVLEEYGMQKVYRRLAEQASRRAERYVFGGLKIGTAMTAFDGRILGMDGNAGEIGGMLGWKL